MAGGPSEKWAGSEEARLLAKGVAGGLEQVISVLDVSGSAGSFKMEPVGAQPQVWSAWVDPIWFELDCDLAEGAVLRAGCALGTVRALALLLSADKSQSDEKARGTYTEILNQAASVLGRELAAHLGKPVNFSAAAESEPPADLETGQGFQFTLAGAKHALALVPDSTLIAALLPAEEPEEDAAEADDGSVGPDAAKQERNEGSGNAQEAAASSAAVERANFDLLLEIEMQLGVSFGRSHLPLEDVLKLSSGSIVELNRSVTDPVDVLVNDAVIARGEVVVVEGNYGVRITEIVSRRERIRSIF